MNYDEDTQRVTVTLDIPAGPGTEIIAVGALLDLLDHLQHDGIQPQWITLDIGGPPTTP
jgi:hypothetical protein